VGVSLTLPTQPVGVLGLTNATNGIGVSGIALIASGTAGLFNNTKGGKILSGQANGVEVFAVSNSGGVTANSLLPALNAVAFSLTPTFDASLGNTQQFTCSTAGSTVSPTFSNLTKGESVRVVFVQNGTTACTLTWPANVHFAAGDGTLSTTLSSVNVFSFIVSNNGTDLYETDQKVGMTGGTP